MCESVVFDELAVGTGAGSGSLGKVAPGIDLGFATPCPQSVALSVPQFFAGRCASQSLGLSIVMETHLSFRSPRHSAQELQ